MLDATCRWTTPSWNTWPESQAEKDRTILAQDIEDRFGLTDILSDPSKDRSFIVSQLVRGDMKG